jgi:energy-coupling factor transport system permease protein
LILTTSTKPLDLTYAIEWYLAPLKKLRFPSHEVAMTISIALRFIPTLLEEAMRIMNAQASRGVDFVHGKMAEKIRAIISLIVPLFISSFQRSEELANAMEARGYNPLATRTRYRQLAWKNIDTLSLSIVLLVFIGILLLQIIDFNITDYLL